MRRLLVVVTVAFATMGAAVVPTGCASSPSNRAGPTTTAKSGTSTESTNDVSNSRAVDKSSPNILRPSAAIPAARLARVGAASYVVPKGFRRLAPSESVDGDAGGASVEFLIPAKTPVASSHGPDLAAKGLITLSITAAPPKTTWPKGCEAMVDEMALSDELAAADDEMIPLSDAIGPSCLVVGTDEDLGFAGFVLTAGRAIQVLATGALATRDRVEKLLRSLHVEDPRLVVGQELTATMAEGFRIIDYEQASASGGMTVAKGDSEEASAVFFAIPLELPPAFQADRGFRTKEGCALLAKVVSSTFGLEAGDAKAVPKTRGKECVTYLGASDDNIGTTTAYVQVVGAERAMVLCTTKFDDDSAMEACFNFGRTLRLTPPPR